MRDKSPISAIASFAVLKVLNDSQEYRSPYQLLSKFIEYIICEEQLHTFKSEEMRFMLQNHFGFNVPEAVIRASLQNLKYIERTNNVYKVNNLVSDKGRQFVEVKNNAETKYNKIVDKIVAHVKLSYAEADTDEIIRAIISYLVDDDDTSPYRDMISTFILLNENNDDMQELLNAIREGGILYLGINRNISEWGSLKNELTLYLDTEILFSLVGFNGSVCQRLSEDFYQLVQKGNRKSKIHLRYFRDVKLEIKRFFRSAELIVAKEESLLKIKPAMKYIINGCSTSADVLVKQADFFDKLKTLGISEDSTENYYSNDLNKFNLEHLKCESEDECDAWKFVSHINKLRQGRVVDFELDSRALIVTNTAAVLKVSKAQCDDDKKEYSKNDVANYAVSLNRIISLLWYKLDGGFGGDKFPSNALVLLRARMVLSSIIAKKASDLYNENINKYVKGEINQEQLATRIMVLREKPTLPEEVKNDNYEQALDFSAESLERYEIELQSYRQYRENQEKIVREIQTASQEILEAKNKELEEKEEVIRLQQNKLQEYQKKEVLREERKRKFRCAMKVMFKIVCLLGILCLVVYANYKRETLGWFITIVIDFGGLIGTVLISKKLFKWLKS